MKTRGADKFYAVLTWRSTLFPFDSLLVRLFLQCTGRFL
jgi:hypothetical protein